MRPRDPRNVVRVIVEGTAPRDLTRLNRMQGMLAVAQPLNDAELAELTNYLRSGWGTPPSDVGADHIAWAWDFAGIEIAD